MSHRVDRHLRYMALADLPQVTAIDRMAFDIPWSLRSYQYEILESPYSHMVVLEERDERPAPVWRQWMRRLRPAPDTGRILGYGGMWLISGGAHISTIAVHPDVRGHGWGEVLLMGMVRRAITLNAHEVTLEVRVSNERAQNLYRKHGFETTSVKPNYYRNNNEDAYDMCLAIRDVDIRNRAEAAYIAALERHPVVDSFSDGDLPPHLTEDGR